MKGGYAIVLGAVIAAMTSAVPAGAFTKNPECVSSAAADYILCKQVCRENFQVEKDLCRDIDHACAETCRTGREACMTGTEIEPGPITQLRTCTSGCKDALEAERTRCMTEQCPEGSENREACLDACIDAAQVIAFQCRDGCREEARPGIRGCREQFRICIKDCPPSTPAN